MAVDLTALWDFSDPALSERRLADALVTASGDDALVLRTQLARARVLLGDVVGAQQVLHELEPELPAAGTEVRVRHALEHGRTLSSAAHDEATQTDEVRSRARADYERALELARTAGLDGLAVDALHMLAFVDPAPADQLRWGREALAVALGSGQPEARRWEASMRHNIGCALLDLGCEDEALAEFEQAVVLRERGNDDEATRVAHWMVARTLRLLGRTEEALGIQQRLERERDEMAAPDPYVFEELETLYRDHGETALAQAAAARRVALDG